MFLLPLLIEHPAMHHDAFTLLASRKFPPEILNRYLREMAALHAACWHWPETTLRMLRREGFAEHADVLNALFEAEMSRKQEFAKMARLLANGTKPESWETELALASLQNHETDALVEHIIGGRTFDAFGALGGIFALKIAMDAQIIPGEKKAFVTMGYYDLAPEDVLFLTQRPTARVATLGEIVDAAPKHDEDRRELEKGFMSTLKQLHAFYDGLERILRSAA